MPRLLKVLYPVLALVALCALGVFISCGNGSQAQVRFFHAIANTTTLDIEFNGTVDIRGVGFGSVGPGSGYATVPAGSLTVEGLATGTTTEAFTVSNVNITAGTEYTMVASGPNTSDVNINSFADNNTEPADGTINFRIIEAAPQGPDSVYVYIVPNPVVGNGCASSYVASGLTVNSASSYIPAPYNSNGGYWIYVCNSAGGNPLIAGVDIGNIGNSSEGSIRTIVLYDNSQGTALGGIKVLDDLN